MPQRYAALSYCWGGPQSLVLTSSSEAELRDKVQWSSLPQSIQDAALVCIRLGIEYLWVEALCIPQDDDHVKAVEIAAMARIYGSAWVTIAAPSSSSVYHRFLSRSRNNCVENPSNIFELAAIAEDGQEGTVAVMDQSHQYSLYENGVNRDPLEERAWALQEFVLSHRVLDFSTTQLRWVCRCVEATQDWVDGGAFRRDKDCRDYLRDVSGPDASKAWQSIVSEFTLRSHTDIEDRVQAISGIAEKVGSILNNKYYAGLWRSALPTQLIWKTIWTNDENLNSVRGADRTELRPSWSWFAMSGPVDFIPCERPMVQIEDMRCQLTTESAPFGMVRNAVLHLRGRLKEAILVRSRDVEKNFGDFHYGWRNELFENRYDTMGDKLYSTIHELTVDWCLSEGAYKVWLLGVSAPIDKCKEQNYQRLYQGPVCLILKHVGGERYERLGTFVFLYEQREYDGRREEEPVWIPNPTNMEAQMDYFKSEIAQ